MRRGILLLSLALYGCHTPSSPSSLTAAAPEARPAALGPLGGSDVAPVFPFPRILCFGDSLTAGVTQSAPDLGLSQLTPVEGYVPKLAILLGKEYGEGVTLINSGMGGETTDRGLTRLIGETLIYRPDLVLLLEGVTDVNNDDPRFGSARANLKEMVRVVKGRSAAVIIGTLPPLNPEGFRAHNPEAAVRLNEFIRRIAEEEQILLADHERAFSGNLGLQGPDGLHPNDDGYEVMAETWLAAIREASRGR